MKLTNELIFRNLLLIQKVEKEGLPWNKFVDVTGVNLRDSQDLIAYLLKNDLIEIEGEENVFFLTDVGYKAVEVGGWYDKDLEENIKPREPRALKYSKADSEESTPKQPYLTSLRGQAIVLSVLVGIGSFLYALDYTEVVKFFGSEAPEKPKQAMDSDKEEERNITYLRDFDKMTYYQNFNWFSLDGDILTDSVRSKATIGVENVEVDSFNILVYGHHTLNDSFHFVLDNGIYTSQFTSFGEKYGSAFDYKREILLDQKKDRIIVLLYSRLRPEEPNFWPINAIIELYPERYDEYWFHLYENPPIDKDKLLRYARIRDYINKEKLKASRHKEYGFTVMGEAVEFTSVSIFENDTLNQEWKALESTMVATSDLKFSNDVGMRLWYYFLHLIDYKDLSEIGY